MKKRTWRSWVFRVLVALIGVFAAFSLFAIASAWSAFGKKATGPRRERMEKSAQWSDGAFENPQPLRNDAWGSIAGIFEATDDVAPQAKTPISTAAVSAQTFAAAPPTGLRVTWFGHSTNLIELDGLRILTDPVWSDRASPMTWAGPKRWFEPMIPLDALPPIDVVVISHDHYDHLDHRTLVAMSAWKNTRFVVPLGVAAHLEYWGVPREQLSELDWWERVKVGELEVVMTPARHASGRKGYDMNSTLWAGYAFIGPAHRAYYSGDTGLFPAMKDIGEKLGPFDLTMIEVGQYHRAWPDWHIGPEQAVTAHQLVKGRVLLPVHYGLFTLASHNWTEPIERALAAGKKDGQTVFVPRPGQSFEPQALPEQERWWPDISWKTGEQDPIVSTQMN